MNKPEAVISAESPMEALSTYIASALKRPLPPEVQAKTKDHVLDTMAALISGSRLDPGELTLKFFATQGGTPEAHIAGSRIVTSAINAAWANGILGHADETDDNHIPGLTHPGCSIVPTSLAIGEKVDASGTAFLAAVTLGYDVATRTSQSLKTKLFGEGRYIHSISGMMGCAASAAALLGFTPEKIRYLFSYMAQQASGIWSWKQGHDHAEKAFVVGGMPARNAAAAALMVDAGFIGIDDVFAGQGNFFEAFAPDGKPMNMVRELGEHYEIMRANIKKWCVGGPVQAPLDGVETLFKRGIGADRIAALEVRIATRDARIVDNTAISNIGLQHLLALMLVDRRLDFASAHDLARLDDPQVRQQRTKITLIHDDELQKLLPHRHAILNATLTDGKIESVRIEGARGTFGNPMTSDEVKAKARDLIVPVIGAAATEQLIEASSTLEKARSVRAIAGMLAADPQG